MKHEFAMQNDKKRRQLHDTLSIPNLFCLFMCFLKYESRIRGGGGVIELAISLTEKKCN